MSATATPSKQRSGDFRWSLPTSTCSSTTQVSRSVLIPPKSADLDAWEAMVDTNIKGLMYVTRAVLPGMVARNHGLIVNLGSIAATYPYPGGNVYGATKAFVRQFSLNLRADLLGTRVRVTDVEPGLVGGTEFSTVRFRGDGAKAAKLYAGADALTPEDIAETVHWIATLPPRSQYQCDRTHAGDAGFRAAPRPSRGEAHVVPENAEDKFLPRVRLGRQ